MSYPLTTFPTASTSTEGSSSNTIYASITEPSSIKPSGLVSGFAKKSKAYESLNAFLNLSEPAQSQPRFTIATIAPESTTSDPFKLTEVCGIEQLATELEMSSGSTDGYCRLYIVENVCPKTMIILQEHFTIDPQFFADHLSDEPWYRIEDVAGCSLRLPSIQKYQEFLQLRYLEVRTISDCQSTLCDCTVEERANPYNDAPSNRRSFEMADAMTTNIPRKAGKLNPRQRELKTFEPLLRTRQVATVWFRKGQRGDQGWTGVVLLDPKFKHSGRGTHCQPTVYPSLNRGASILDEPKKVVLPTSTMEAFVCHLKEQFTNQRALLHAARLDSFLFIDGLYRMVASNWVHINEYVNRELVTIEYILEKKEPGFRDLEVYLKDLYIFRRQCVKHRDLITEAKEQCRRRGQRYWARDETSPLAAENAKELEEDFSHLQEKIRRTKKRIAKNIKLLTSLVAIGTGKQGLDENHGLARLNLLAIIFVPFATIAAILGIDGRYGPGEQGFLVFWVVAIPVTFLVFILSASYGGIGNSLLKQAVGVLNFKKMVAQAAKVNMVRRGIPEGD